MANRPRARNSRNGRSQTSEERMPRQLEDREHEERPQVGYTPPSALPTPEPRDGYRFRWVRVSMVNQSDKSNVSKRFREGWEPAKLEDFPELQVEFSIFDDDNRFAKEGLIEVGGLVLCKMAEERAQARDDHYNNLARNQMVSVDNNLMRENDSRMPLLRPERSTWTTFGRDTGY